MADPGLTVTNNEAANQFVKKTYVFNGYRVTLAKKEPYAGGPPEAGLPTLAAKPDTPAATAAPPKPGLLDRLKRLLKRGV